MDIDMGSGTGNVYDYGFRIYNPRIAKFLSVDPLTKSYPWYTPYQFAGNKPIEAIDLDGLEDFHVNSVTITGEILKLKLETAEGIKELRHKVNYWSNKKFLHTKEGHDHLMDITGNKDLTWRVCTDYNFYGHTGMRVYGLAKNGKEFLIYDDMKEIPGAFSNGSLVLERNRIEGTSDGGLVEHQPSRLRIRLSVWE